PAMRPERIATAFTVLAILLVGCTNGSAPPNRDDQTVTPTQTTVDDESRVALKRTEVQLAASRAEVDELRRLLDTQAKKQEEQARANPLPPPGREFAILARQRLHDCCISSVAFSPDGKHIATADANGRVLVSTATDLQPEVGVEAVTGE